MRQDDIIHSVILSHRENLNLRIDVDRWSSLSLSLFAAFLLVLDSMGGWFSVVSIIYSPIPAIDHLPSVFIHPSVYESRP